MRPTLAMVGDSRGGGSGREGILPLDDPAAMDAIAGALASRMGRGGNTYGSLAEFVGKRAVEKAAPWKSPQAELSPCA